MTEKRFTMCHEQNDLNGWTMSIIDWETNEPFDYAQYEVHSESITDTKDEMEDLCLLLNELNDENEQLKSREEYLERKIDRERTSYQKQHEKWEEEIQKENEQLKEEIKDFQDLLGCKEAELLKPIMNALDEAIRTERTMIGQSVLKQFKEQIQ